MSAFFARKQQFKREELMKAAIYYNPEDIRCTQIDDARINFAHSILVNASFIR